MKKQPMTATTTAISNLNTIKPAFKLERVLTYLVENGSINRLEAEKKPVFDHALNSTMSNEFKLRLGLKFTSIPEKTTGYDGLGAIFNRYTFTAESTIKAKQLINEYRAKRGASLIQWKGAA
jgi:hypothetical protein